MTARIPLHAADGSVKAWALVDEADVSALSQWRWSLGVGPRGQYARRGKRVGGRFTHIRMHRQILGLVPGDGMIVDHINGDPLDNRRANLRLATSRLNALNMKPKTSSGYTGVAWNPRRRLWIGRIDFDGTHIYLGGFDDVHAAGRVVAAKRAELVATEAQKVA